MAIDTTPTTDAPKKSRVEELMETTRDRSREQARMSASMDSLPGNNRWTERLGVATRGRLSAFRTWAGTIKDRNFAHWHAGTAGALEGKLGTLELDTEKLEKKLLQIQMKRDTLMIKNEGRNKIFQWWTNNVTLPGLAQDESATQDSLQVTRSEAEAVKLLIQRARDKESKHDRRINSIAEKHSKSLRDQLAIVEVKKRTLDAEAEKYGNIIREYEEGIAAMRGKMLQGQAVLLGRKDFTEAQRTQARNVLRELNRKILRAEASLETEKKAYQSCEEHRSRVARSHMLLQSEISRVVGGYAREVANASTIPHTEAGNTAMEAQRSRAGMEFFDQLATENNITDPNAARSRPGQQGPDTARPRAQNETTPRQSSPNPPEWQLGPQEILNGSDPNREDGPPVAEERIERVVPPVRQRKEIPTRVPPRRQERTQTRADAVEIPDAQALVQKARSDRDKGIGSFVKTLFGKGWLWGEGAFWKRKPARTIDAPRQVPANGDDNATNAVANRTSDSTRAAGTERTQADYGKIVSFNKEDLSVETQISLINKIFNESFKDTGAFISHFNPNFKAEEYTFNSMSGKDFADALRDMATQSISTAYSGGGEANFWKYLREKGISSSELSDKLAKAFYQS